MLKRICPNKEGMVLPKAKRKNEDANGRRPQV